MQEILNQLSLHTPNIPRDNSQNASGRKSWDSTSLTHSVVVEVVNKGIEVELPSEVLGIVSQGEDVFCGVVLGDADERSGGELDKDNASSTKPFSRAKVLSALTPRET